MSFLAPLYALGALAIIGPLVFHLIRRAPKGEVPFSSLMFLSSTPPRLTRRSRLDNILLLLLRAAALAILAVAFARPFLREAATLDVEGGGGRRVAYLVDASASMRRAGLMEKAQALAKKAIEGGGPGDQVALFEFDESTRPLMTFEESATLEPTRRQAIAVAAIGGIEPTWGGTRLDQALIDAVAALEGVADVSESASRTPRRVVLVSDLQEGARLDALGDFEWPSDVSLEVIRVADEGANAGLSVAASPASAEGDGSPPGVRARVTNDADSRRESFALRWADADGVESGEPVNVYVPPGESRVVRAPQTEGPEKAVSLRLVGDAHGFDNTLYVVPTVRTDATVLYLGDEAADDPAGLLYYLDRVFEETPTRKVRVETQRPSDPLTTDPTKPPSLVVLHGETTPANAKVLRALAEEGATVLYIYKSPGPADSPATVAEAPPFEITEGPAGDVLLEEIDFSHPLFAAVSGPRFNDFTKVRFWRHGIIPADALGESRTLARFEGGDPAFIEKEVGKGRLVVMATGWGPTDGQLARSSKFVPLMAAMLDRERPDGADGADHLVNAQVSFNFKTAATVTKPDGAAVPVAAGSAGFDGADQPGVYRVEGDGPPRSFAVNLSADEGRTAPLALETLEQFGCKLAGPGEGAAAPEDRRQLRNAELEGRQKLWRWLVVAALAILTLETWLAGRQSRPRRAPAEALLT